MELLLLNIKVYSENVKFRHIIKFLNFLPIVKFASVHAIIYTQ